jgi:pimeloyl-ACP methyl ester carboxylesterase
VAQRARAALQPALRFDIRDEGPAWERYAALRIPVLTIHGTQDRNAPFGGGREWVAHLPEAR